MGKLEQDSTKTRVGNYYTTQYSDAWDVAEKKIDQLPALTETTLDFVNTFSRSSYPEVIKEAALFNLSTLRSQTVFLGLKMEECSVGKVLWIALVPAMVRALMFGIMNRQQHFYSMILQGLCGK